MARGPYDTAVCTTRDAAVAVARLTMLGLVELGGFSRAEAAGLSWVDLLAEMFDAAPDGEGAAVLYGALVEARRWGITWEDVEGAGMATGTEA